MSPQKRMLLYLLAVVAVLAIAIGLALRKPVGSMPIRQEAVRAGVGQVVPVVPIVPISPIKEVNR